MIPPNCEFDIGSQLFPMLVEKEIPSGIEFWNSRGQLLMAANFPACRITAEGAAVFAAVQRQALAHPEVSFRFLRDGRQIEIPIKIGKRPKPGQRLRE